jgi:hypothetical protein
VRPPERLLRAPTPGLLALPWDLPLARWLMPDVPCTEPFEVVFDEDLEVD